MNDLKSKLPDIKEISSMACKLFKDVKASVSEIIEDYKKKREGDEIQDSEESVEKKAAPKTAKRKTTKGKVSKDDEV